jgi:hypothetical protein
MKMRRLVLVPLVLVAIVAVPAAAQAAPHWYKKNVLVGPAPVPVATSGMLTLSALGTEISCKVKDAEEIWNPVGGGPGEDLITGFTLTNCKAKKSSAACAKGAVEVLANGLPWPSVLVAGIPIWDEIQKVRLLIRCNPGTIPDEFEGTLMPEVGNGALIFAGPITGTLFDIFLNPLTIVGKDKLISKPGKVTAKDP